MADFTKDIAKWRLAHQWISVPDAGLATMAPFPSLYAGDFAVFLEASGQPKEFVRFIVDMKNEIAWVYDNWQKAQHDGDPKRLIEDMLNNTSAVGSPQGGGPTPDYSMVKTFLRDYAKGHGIQLGSEDAGRPSWMDALGAPGTVAQGTGTDSVGGDTVFPQARPMTATGGITAPPGPMPEAEAPNAVPDR